MLRLVANATGDLASVAMHSDTHLRLLDAAVEMIIDADVFTTGRIAQRAGVVQSAFYNHFSSVVECRRVALQEIERRVIDAAAPVFAELQRADAVPDEDVERILLEIFNRAEQHPTVYRLLVHRRHDDDVGAVVDQTMTSLRSALVETIRRARTQNVADDDAQTVAAAHIILAILTSGIEQVLNGSGPGLVATICAAFMTNGLVSDSP